MHEHVCLGCIWETKRADMPRLSHSCEALQWNMWSPHIIYSTASLHTSINPTVRDPWRCKHKSAWESEIYKVCTHTVLTYSTHTALTHTHLHVHTNTINKPPIPTAAVDSADSATLWLTFEDESPEPPKENSALPGMSRNVNCRRLSPHSDTDGCDGKARRSHTEAG